MAYHFDNYDNSLVIDGFEKGIGESPFSGLADMRNVNIVSIPGEVSVGFATSKVSNGALNCTVLSADPATEYITFTGDDLDSGVAISFSGGSLPGGIVAGTIYWVGNYGGAGAGTFKIYTDYALTSLVNITSTGTGSLTAYVMGKPKYQVTDTSAANGAAYWLIDANGLVWTNLNPTTTNNWWRYAGNKPNNYSQGNGLGFYQASNGTGYIFAFSKSSIDYTVAGAAANVSWTYQWNPAAGTTGAYSATPADVLNTSHTVTNPIHETLTAPDNRLYYTDGQYIGKFFENSGSTFNPATIATYTPGSQSLLPKTDVAQCLAFLGTNLMIGGKNNIIYPWDRFSTNFSFPLLLPEYNIVKMVTLNTNTYIFVGNRGRIYYTNGTNATLYKKVPDHISGTVEPYFTWGGATTVKNQLYFGVSATTNGGSAINQYGGVWAIDTDTDAIRLVNKLSYGTYAGIATTLIPIFTSNPAGAGLYIGWDDGNSGYGLDTTTSTPYIGSQTTIDSDLIPIGTYERPRDFSRIEYRLVKGLVSGESITIKTRLIFNTSDTGYSTTLTDSTVGNYSNAGDVNFLNAQWVQFQIVLNSTSSNPSYVRLKEIRIRGLVGSTPSETQLLSL